MKQHFGRFSPYQLDYFSDFEFFYSRALRKWSISACIVPQTKFGHVIMFALFYVLTNIWVEVILEFLLSAISTSSLPCFWRLLIFLVKNPEKSDKVFQNLTNAFILNFKTIQTSRFEHKTIQRLWKRCKTIQISWNRRKTLQML
jgi:hypothetical protein